MIEFKGSQKAFFKAYPKDKRSLDEVYVLINANGGKAMHKKFAEMNIKPNRRLSRRR